MTLHSRFYLHLVIRFHDSRELEMEDVMRLLTHLMPQPLFSYIKHVTLPSPNVIDMHLHIPNYCLPWLLDSLHAMILPREWQAC